MQRDYPSIVEVLFQQAIARLKTVIRLRREAIEYYQARYAAQHFGGTQGNENVSPEVPYIKDTIANVHEESKLITVRTTSLKQINEMQESETSSSQESSPLSKQPKSASGEAWPEQKGQRKSQG